MKKCTWCGQEYPDNATACAVDGHSLSLIESDRPVSNKLVGPDGPVGDGLEAVTRLAASGLLRPEGGFFSPNKMLGLAVREQDNGHWLVWKCPRCLVVADFNAVVSHGNTTLLGLELAAAVTMIDLRCTRCKFDLRVDPQEREILEKLRDATRLLLEGKISRAEYEALVLQTPAQFVKDLSALTRNWKCPGCGEENPVNFDTCWNCSSRHNPEIGEIPEEAKPFPTMPRGGNPWEK
jgi:hypothetical protein